jgi:uncharacterized protein (TIGR03437 family)
MFRLWLIIASLAGASFAQPTYTAASVVHAATSLSGPLAPNTIATIYGSGLAFDTQTAGTGVSLPMELANVRVSVDSTAAPLLYVSERQINFIVPASLQPRTGATLRVFRQGLYGPAVAVDIRDAVPGLFHVASGELLAQHTDGKLITRDLPALPGEIVVVYGTGFGVTRPPLITDNELPSLPFQISRLSELQVMVNNSNLDSGRILYCGVTPLSGGLYQVNFRLPDELTADPEIRVSIAGQASPVGTKLAVRKVDSNFPRSRHVK